MDDVCRKGAKGSGNTGAAGQAGVHDITLCKESEKLFMREIEMWDRILEKLPCISMVIEKETKRIAASNEAARKVGVEVGEFCYEKCSLRSDPCPWCLADKMRDDNEPEKREIKYQGRDYEVLWTPLTDDLFVLYVFDITERKAVEESVRLSEEKFSKVFHNSPDSVTLTNIDSGEFIEVNKGFEEISGYSRDEVLGRSIPDINLWVNSGDREVMVKELRRNGSLKDYEIQVRTKNGGICDCLMCCEIIEIGSAMCLLSITREITERKRVLEQLEIAKEHAEAANAAKSEFLANMSHEIRTPISVIKGFSDMLASEKLTGQQAAYVELIRNAGRSLLVIINDILDYSKIEAGKLDIIVSEHSLEEIVDVVDSMMRPQAVKKGVRFEVIWTRKLPEIIKTDQVRVHECLINLVSNAIKFTDSGFVFLKVGKENRNGELFIRFDVEDSGIGIPPDDQVNIFDSFSQVEKGSTRYFSGAGLGLAITSRLAGLLGGSVSVLSEEGKGSTFTLLIPSGVRAEAYEGTAGRSKRKIVEVKKETPKFSANVLVAEDHEGCQMIIRRMLEMYGLSVTTADDGKEAVDKALAGKFDLMFMDIRMPEFNGFEATDILRRKGVTVPIIALTAHAMEGDRQMCIEAGFSDYLSKPVERDDLLDILGRHARTDENNVIV